MNDKRYQIFVSSTYEDLREERDAVIKAILEMGHSPVGMEMFSADDEDQWKVIRRQIDQTDYYVVIIAHRYGSTDSTGLSFTEKEYDYACTKSVPTLAFVIDENVQWPPSRMDADAGKQKLARFKAKAKSKYVSTWVSREDLCAKVSIALVKQFNVNPRVGWVRADSVASPETTNELSRLSKENAELREQLVGFVGRETKAREEREETEEAIRVLQLNTRPIAHFYVDGKEWEGHRSVSLHLVFSVLAPTMQVETSSLDAASSLGVLLRPEKDYKRAVRVRWPVPSNFVNDMFADLAALGLIQPSSRKHAVKDNNE